MHVDFNATFHPVPVLDFIDVFLVRAVMAQRGEYPIEEPELDLFHIHCIFITQLFVLLLIFMSFNPYTEFLFGSNAHT